MTLIDIRGSSYGLSKCCPDTDYAAAGNQATRMTVTSGRLTERADCSRATASMQARPPLTTACRDYSDGDNVVRGCRNHFVRKGQIVADRKNLTCGGGHTEYYCVTLHSCARIAAAWPLASANVGNGVAEACCRWYWPSACLPGRPLQPCCRQQLQSAPSAVCCQHLVFASRSLDAFQSSSR